jgi:hypothetical protein
LLGNYSPISSSAILKIDNPALPIFLFRDGRFSYDHLSSVRLPLVIRK